MKEIIKVALIGAEQSGKTQLSNRMMNSQFDSKYRPTIGDDFATLHGSDKTFQIWDTAGQERFRSLIYPFRKKFDIFFYCVDLSSPNANEYTKKEIEDLKQISPDALFFLVGTKSDLCLEDPNKKLAHIEIEGIVFAERIITTAKDNMGIAKLRKLLISYKKTLPLEKIIEKPVLIEKSVLEDARDKLLKSLEQLPEDKNTKIKNEIDTLLDRLNNPLSEITPDAAISQFSSTCKDYLKSTYPKVLKAVLVVAAAAAVTVIAGLVGFGIGFALGAWTGPGTFITAIIAGGAAAATVGGVTSALGLGTAGLVSYGLFKKSQEETAISDFVKEIKPV